MKESITYGYNKIKNYKIPIIVGFIVALLAHTFMFANKLINHDDIYYLFGKGATVSSGRWGLELLSSVFPDFSLPWINGIISTCLMITSACVACSIFKIKNKWLQALVVGNFIAFPSLTATYIYMFTASSYAVAFLLSVIAVKLFISEKWWHKIISAVCMMFMFGIYQAYISITATLFLLYVIQQFIKEEKKPAKIIINAFMFLGVMIVALIGYYVISLLAQKLFNVELNSYATGALSATTSIMERVKLAYKEFKQILTTNAYGIIPFKFSRLIHIVCIGVAAIKLFLIWCKKNVWAKIFLPVLFLLLPLSINCMFLASSTSTIHTLVLHGFCMTYLVFAVIVDEDIEYKSKIISLVKKCSNKIVSLALCLIVIANIYVANEVYLCLHLKYENAFAYYTSVVTTIKNTPGFDENSKLALIGNKNNLEHQHNEFHEIRRIIGTFDITHVYSNYEFVQRYIGFDMPKASNEEINRIVASEEYKNMPEYPYYGSVKAIDDIIVVKFGNQ